MKLEKLLKELEPSIDYLVSGIRIRGMQRDDLAQELKLQVVKEYKKHKNKDLGWWFIRLRWALLNKLKAATRSKEPLDHSTSLQVYYIEKMKNENAR